MKAPRFWHAPVGWQARALAPIAWAYDTIAATRRAGVAPFAAPVPVICIGNLTVGGAGKTPCALAVRAILAELGRTPAFISRGYGGSARGNRRVDPTRDDAAIVGDEPLLLARAAPTYIGAARDESARRAVADGATVLVMDDGLHNPSLRKDFSIIVVDGAAGFGNARVLPAGPLRENLDRGLARATLFVLVGDDSAQLETMLAAHAPVFRARLVPIDPAPWRGRRVFAFAGIGRPEKFFATLAGLGADLAGTRAFDDHHPYSVADLLNVRDAARAANAIAVTTEKDWIRIPADRRGDLHALAVTMVFDKPDELTDRLRPVLASR